MDLYLQFGWGMMGHSRELIDEWDGGCVILSPRDLEPDQLTRLSDDVRELGGEVVLDPQFYLPDATHHRLRAHDYWPDEYASDTFWDEEGDYRTLMAEIHGLNRHLGTAAAILPGIHTEQLDGEWYERQVLLQEAAQDLFDEEDTLLATISLTADPLHDGDAINELLEQSEDWPVDGFYLLGEHPPNQYLVSDPVWLYHLLDLVAGWRLRDKEVVIGYCNQQMIVSACAAPTAMSTGTWKNVRSFPPGKFHDRDQELRRSTWYYAPRGLSEYQLAYLDIAQDEGILEQLAPPNGIGGGYADQLFAGPEPTAVGLAESPNAFRHYLMSLRQQVLNVQHDSFRETFDAVSEVVAGAGRLTGEWRARGIRGGDREFSADVHAATESALTRFERNRGPMLGRRWEDLADADD